MAVVTALVVSSALVSCSSESGPPTLAWYINPDDGGQVELARRCTEAAGGGYKIETSLLPNDASAQREQLLRRLAAEDSSIALISLDPVFVAEFSDAGFLAPIPEADAQAFTDGVLTGAVEGGTWDGKLVAIPFWANTQLLWYRKSVAEQAGLDPENTPVTWDQLITAAKDAKKTVAVQGKRYEGYTVWINALIESAGGQVVEQSAEDGADVKLGIESPAGDEAARIIRDLANAGIVSRRCRPRTRRRHRHVPGRRRRLHGQLAVRLEGGEQRRRGRQPGAVGRRRHRLGAVPADDRGHGEQATARRHRARHRRLHAARRPRPRRRAAASRASRT